MNKSVMEVVKEIAIISIIVACSYEPKANRKKRRSACVCVYVLQYRKEATTRTDKKMIDEGSNICSLTLSD